MSTSPYQQSLIRTLEENDLNLGPIVKKILDHIKQDSSIWVAGNGGSASTVERFEMDMHFIRSKPISKSPKVYSLTSNTSLISAIANDIGFENVFSFQISRKAKSGDLCIVLSGSGNSENLINLIRTSKNLGLFTIGILGFDGGQLLDLVDMSVLIRTEKGKYGQVEDIHQAICHEISSRVFQDLVI
jgi:D-sedoheptulose 7-phosphate isomerase